MAEVRLNRNNKVLLLDDNLNNLQSFKANFRKDYTVYIAQSAKDALRMIAEFDIPVVISDYRMPEQDGVSFLETVKNEFPYSLRIMLTGHADLPAVVQAINQSEIFRFLTKPWKYEELKKGIDDAFSLYETRLLLEKKNLELKKAYVELDRLVYSTAHDFTGPLSNILGLITLIRMDKDQSEEYINLIERTTKKLTLLAKDVLSFHRNKRTKVENQNVRLHQLVHAVLNEYQYYENADKINYSIEIDQVTPLITDKSRLRFILNNLLSNAIKFQDKTKENRSVEIKAVVSDEELVLSIEDNGIGIPEERQAKIFEIYYRGSNLSTGAGIGLYIVKEAVDVVNGEIVMTSKLGEGTRFTIKVPNLLLVSQD